MELPKRVYFKHGAYYYVPRPGERHLYGGKSWIRLGTTKAEAMAECARLVGREQQGTMRAVFSRYRRDVLPTKGERTRKDQDVYLDRLESAFGQFRPDQVETTDVYRYLDHRGQTAPVAANREISLLGHVFQKAIRWGECKTNPCSGIEKHDESPRDRYVEHWELDAWCKRARPVVALVSELAYLTGLRRADLLAMTRSQFREDGILVKSAKTGRRGLIGWTPDLRRVIDELARIPKNPSIYVVATRTGQPYSGSGFNTLWKRDMAAALADEECPLTERFRLHDLRAKHATDAKAQGLNPTDNLLHDREATTAAYLRSKEAVQITPLTRSK